MNETTPINLTTTTGPTIIGDVFHFAGVFSDPLALVAGGALEWALIPGVVKWTSASFIRHEEGPRLRLGGAL